MWIRSNTRKGYRFTDYNTIREAIEISFVAEFDLSTGKVSTFNASVLGHGAADLLSADKASGVVTVQVKNSQGATLPETGGIGTVIFVVVGTLAVLGTGVLLVTKKRMSMIED